MRANQNTPMLELFECRHMLTAFLPLGTFGLTEEIPVVSSGDATAATVADFNRDGDLDLAFGSAQRRAHLDEVHSTVGIALGDGHTGFDRSVEQTVHDDIFSMIAADLNDDGFPDIVAGGIYRLSVFLSELDTDGNWQRLGEARTIGGASEQIVVEDFDGDGSLDIASAAKRQWFPWGVPPQPSVENRDVTGVYIYKGDGTGQFPSVARYEGTEFLIQEDYDGDGDLDLITRHVPVIPEPFGIVLLNESEGPFGNNRESRIAFKAGDTITHEEYRSRIEQPTYDINGDAVPDLLESQIGYDWGLHYTPTETAYRLGQADGSFDRAVHLADIAYNNWQEFELGSQAERALASTAPPFVFDVDGNGANDFVHVRGDSIRIVRQRDRLDGYASMARNYPSLSNQLYYSEFLDLNFDGLLDFVAHDGYHGASRIQNGRFVQYGQADGSFGAAQFFSEEEINEVLGTELNPSVFLGDFNNDGFQDKVEWIHNHRLDVSLANEEGELSLSQRITDYLWLIGVDDADGDGVLDLLVVDPGSRGSESRRMLMKGDGSGNFLTGETYVAPTTPTTFHRRGGVSVTVHEPSSVFSSYYVPKLAKFQILVPTEWQVQLQTSGPNHEAKHIDVDGDGDLDVLVGHGGGVAVVLAIGEGDFDQDGSLTMDDFAILAQNFGAANVSPEQGDLNEDAQVDFKDFLEFAHKYRVTFESAAQA